ncbi:MAG: hypothetical protein ACQERG_00850 [Pseudomonadota bacterium]
MSLRALLAPGLALLLVAGCGTPDDLREEAEEAEAQRDHDRAMDELDQRRED